MNIPWWGYVILAGLSWGTYVPIIFYGGQVLSVFNPAGQPVGVGGRLASILCVGVAYFVMAVVIPIALMYTLDDGAKPKPEWRSVGLVFSSLAGIAGAVGAICVIFASNAATGEARTEFNDKVSELKKGIEEAKTNDPAKAAELEQELKAFQDPIAQKKFMARYRMFIAPLIFCLAPLINTLLSLVWHPGADPKTDTYDWAIFHMEMPGWKLLVGILFVSIGTFLVLMSKEDMEANKAPTQPKAPPSATSQTAGS